jgi:hypothetical protein
MTPCRRWSWIGGSSGLRVDPKSCDGHPNVDHSHGFSEVWTKKGSSVPQPAEGSLSPSTISCTFTPEATKLCMGFQRGVEHAQMQGMKRSEMIRVRICLRQSWNMSWKCLTLCFDQQPPKESKFNTFRYTPEIWNFKKNKFGGKSSGFWGRQVSFFPSLDSDRNFLNTTSRRTCGSSFLAPEESQWRHIWCLKMGFMPPTAISFGRMKESKTMNFFGCFYQDFQTGPHVGVNNSHYGVIPLYTQYIHIYPSYRPLFLNL